MHRSLLAAAAFTALSSTISASPPAMADGMTRVQQSDGSVKVYRGVRMDLIGKTLRLHSPDRAGILVIQTDACAVAGGIRRCLPYASVLHQGGKSHRIALERGAVYFNLTTSAQPLAHSSDHLAPREVLVTLHSARGTFITVRGTLDDIR